MSPDDIQKAIESDPQFAPPPTTGQRAMGFLKDLGKGLGESAIGLMSTGDNAARKIPGIGEWLTTPITGTPADQAIAHTNELATPEDTTQAVGKGIGNAAQFAIPAAQRGRVEFPFARLPWNGEIAPLVRGVAGATASGGVNKAQGGSFGAGAAIGGLAHGITGLQDLTPYSTERAGKLFESVMQDAGNQPITLAAADGANGARAAAFGARGGTVSAIDNLYKRINSVNPLDYREARDWASNLSRLIGARS